MLRHEDYRKLLMFRTALRRFLRWSESQAELHGMTGAQHQLLLAIAGAADDRGPTVGDVADSLLLQHHSAVGLVDRAEAARLLRRRSDPDDHRVVRLELTALGRRRLESLTEVHVEELRALAPVLDGLLRAAAEKARRTA